MSISLAGAPFDGRYMLSSTRHVFDRHGYRTHFVVAGRQERSLLGLTSLGATNGAPGQASTAASAGVAIAIVTDVADPTGQGRVRVRLPWLAEGYESDWARVVHAGAGAGRGWVVVPEVNDEVLVAFDHGDTRRPYVLGGLYNGVDRHGLQGDPVDAGSGSISRRGLVTRVGHRIEFVEDGSDGGAKLATRDDGVVVQLVAAGTTLRLRANGDITIEAKGGNVAVKAAAQLTLEAGADLSIKSGGAVSISGTVIRLN